MTVCPPPFTWSANSYFLSFLSPCSLHLQRALSRKGSNRMERKGGDELLEQEDLARKLIIKGKTVAAACT